MSVCYYLARNVKIFKNTKKSEIGDLKEGYRVVAIDTNLPMIYDSMDLEGPFLDKKSLINNSKWYKELITTNSKRAHKIVQEEYILKPEGLMLSPKGREYEFNFIEGFVHSVFGKFKDDEVNGIHFFDENKVRITEILESNEKGVWRAKIEVLDSKTDKWKVKHKPTDFFPITWNRSTILDELYFANENKRLRPETDKKYDAITKSGINVVFIIENGKIKTIYPKL